jgi:hypothetical protein
MFDGEPEIVIQGVTETDEPFPRRLGGHDVRVQRRWFSGLFAVSQTDHGRRPALRGGGSLLENRDPTAFAFLLQFARNNPLKLRPGHKAKRREELAAEVALRNAMRPPGVQGA